MPQIPDHPIIRNMERTGYPDGKEPSQKVYLCPMQASSMAHSITVTPSSATLPF